uniref:Uncharacterized protein n=1 Tax=Trichobilharzia regenti TaxID=157069 RepID=A0AA85J9J0_TRIRE|nr:unnamed protein product [Trichobilharzia regenti]
MNICLNSLAIVGGSSGIVTLYFQFPCCWVFRWICCCGASTSYSCFHLVLRCLVVPDSSPSYVSPITGLTGGRLSPHGFGFCLVTAHDG